MGLGAIAVIGAGDESFRSVTPQENGKASLLAEPLACVDVIGYSMLERTVERFVRAGVETVSVLVPANLSSLVKPFTNIFDNVKVQIVGDVFSAITDKITQYSSDGIEDAFVVSANLYTETDLLDLYYFHREARQTATRAFDWQVPLDLWVVNCARARGLDLDNLLLQAKGASYFIREYVNRLTHPRDLRRMVTDALRGRCAIRPSGAEIKPGIWVEEGADIHRRARIVAPAYIGRGSQVKEDTLVTRCSSIERDCYIDYGTVVEDSSILANTHIGIWLDVCHGVANGNKLMNLGRDVILEISDPSILRAISSHRPEPTDTLNVSDQTPENETHPVGAESLEVAPQQKEPPAPKAWQLGVNPIQG